ncbi:hypothetical protein JXA02_03165 [candidate division KSB1 bacterium]|nr:hypothetical protein [candidate division KSB1 bacterium]RQW09782.1 MAG: hypothetical protein EH222_03510 [candidate division KSB1 bacterium]
MPIKKLFLFFSLCGQLAAQSIRPNHWIEEDLSFLWHRGYLWELSPLERPFTSSDIFALQDSAAAAAPVRAFQLLGRMAAREESETTLGWLLLDEAYEADGSRSIYHAAQRATLGAHLSPNLQLYAGFHVDNQLDSDSSYLGKRQSGMAAYMEQAFVLFDRNGFRAKFGRDYLVWGPGLDGSLHISAASRPMDHLYLAWKNRWLKLSFFTATLDDTDFPVQGEPSTQHRYLSGHRLELRPFRYARIGLSETALFGGPDAGIDFALLNPMQFYAGVQLNGPQSANVQASVDAAIMPMQNVTLYGSYLLDDMQFEDEAQDDQEPAQYGLAVGLNWADPFAWGGADFFLEYARVTNRTYNGQGGPWEKYLHRRRPIGHFLGNDFDRLIVGVRHRPSAAWRLGLLYEHLRRGEGRIEDDFTTPWRDIGDGQTYSEPFPTGIVEVGDNVRFTARWQPLLWLYGDFYLCRQQLKNAGNQRDAQQSYWEVKVNVSFELLGTASLK